MATSLPLVSVVIVTLNAGKFLPKLFETIANQSYPAEKIEVIVNDDARTSDNTVEVIHSWSDRLRITHLHDNIRLGHGRHVAGFAAKGSLLYFVDADMELTPDILSECVELAHKGAQAIIIAEEQKGPGFWSRCKWLERRIFRGNDLIESARFFVTSDYRRLGGHNPELMFGEDKDCDLAFREADCVMARTEGFVYHNEGRIRFFKQVRRSFFWAQFIKQSATTGSRATKIQSGITWRFAMYAKAWRMELQHPFLTIGMIALRVAELAGAVAGIVFSKFSAPTASYHK